MEYFYIVFYTYLYQYYLDRFFGLLPVICVIKYAIDLNDYDCDNVFFFWFSSSSVVPRALAFHWWPVF